MVSLSDFSSPDSTFRNASLVAKQLFNVWAAEHQAIITQQLSMFDLNNM